jgi:hypothetical protein
MSLPNESTTPREQPLRRKTRASPLMRASAGNRLCASAVTLRPLPGVCIFPPCRRQSQAISHAEVCDITYTAGTSSTDGCRGTAGRRGALFSQLLTTRALIAHSRNSENVRQPPRFSLQSADDFHLQPLCHLLRPEESAVNRQSVRPQSRVEVSCVTGSSARAGDARGRATPRPMRKSLIQKGDWST